MPAFLCSKMVGYNSEVLSGPSLSLKMKTSTFKWGTNRALGCQSLKIFVFYTIIDFWTSIFDNLQLCILLMCKDSWCHISKLQFHLARMWQDFFCLPCFLVKCCFTTKKRLLILRLLKWNRYQKVYQLFFKIIHFFET